MVVATTGARVLWEQPLSRLFAGRALSTDWGWNFERVERAGLYVGSVGSRFPSPAGQENTIELSGGSTSGIAITDGAVRWRNPGSFYACGLFPCPGSARHSTDDGRAAVNGATVGVSLRPSGKAAFDPDRPLAPPRLSADATLTIEGFDVRSGRTLWRFRADPRFVVTQTYAQTATSTVVVRDERGRLTALDLRSGASRHVAGSMPAWCRKSLRYTDLPGWTAPGGKRVTSYVGQDALTPCTADGKPRSAPVTVPRFVADFGAAAGGSAFWSGVKGVGAAPYAR